MIKLRKSAAFVTAILLAAGVLAGLLAFLLPKNSVSARAMTEIDEANLTEYLVTDGTEIQGFRTGVELPHNLSLGIPEGYTVAVEAFNACNRLVKVTLPAGMTEEGIGADAFKECRRLVEIENLSALDIENATASQLFGGIARYALSIYGAGETSRLKEENGYLFITDTVHTGDNVYLLGANALEDGAAVLPAYAQPYAVYDYAFHSRTDLVSLSAAAGAEITEIGRLAFYECPDLEAVDFSAAEVGAIGYSAFTRCVKLTSLTLSEELTKIDGYAFSGCSALSGTLTVPQTVTEIGMDAFRGCSSLNKIEFADGPSALALSSGAFGGCSSLSVMELPARLARLGTNAFTDCAALGTVYFASETEFMANVIPSEPNVYFGGNTLIVFDTPAHYEAAIANSSNAVGHQSMMTYLITVEFKEVTGGSVAKTPVASLLRLKNRAFGFTQNADKSWSVSAGEAEELIPVQDGYSASRWYASESLGGNALNAQAITNALADANGGTVTLYAKRVEKPVVTAKTNLVYSEGKTYSVSNTADFLSAAVTDSDLLLQIKKGTEVQQSGVSDAGVYTFTAKIAEEKFGAWDADFTLEFTVARKPVAIAGEIEWQLAGSGLINGTLYVYQKADGSFVYSSTVIADPAAQGLTYYSALTLENSIARHTDATLTVSLKESEYFTIGAYTAASATNAGKYTSSVEITAKDNYLLRNFGEAGSVTNESRGVTVEIGTDRTTATVSKVWYIVTIGNHLVADGAPASRYTIADWTYGAGSAVAAPALRYGQEAQGANVTFTVARNGAAVGGTFGIARFADVVNPTMPAGEYALTFALPAYDVYPAATDTVSFTVTPAAFKREWKEAITASFADAQRRFNGNLQLYRADDLTGWDGSVPAAAPAGVWANEEDCYSQYFTLSYNFAGAQNRTYYTFEEASGLGEAGYLPKQPGTYTVYYNFTAENYEPLADVASAERTDYGFTFTVFRVVAVPTVSALTYTGNRMLPAVNEGEPNTSSLYEISYDRTEGSYVNAGDTHRVTVTLTDGAHYKWANGAGYDAAASRELVFTINRADNADSLALSIPQWTYGNFDKELHRPIWSTVFTDGSDDFYTFTLTSLSDSTKVFEYDAQNGFNYVPIGTYTLTATAKGYVAGDASTERYNWNRLTRYGTVIITKGANSWAVTPNVMQWEFGGYVKEVNLILAQPSIADADNPVKFKITYDAAGKNAVQGLDDFRANTDGTVSGEVAAVLAGLRAGSYYLWSSVAPTDQYTGIDAKTGFEFKVTRSENYWDEAPAVSSWIVGGYDNTENNITAKPHFGGTVNYVIVLAGDGENVIYDSANGIDRLAEAGAGVYELRASVAGTDDYADLVYSLTFRIFEKAGLAWWAILLIVAGSLCLVALVFFILHQKGVLQIITGKVVLAMRTRATVDATIAAVRANKVAEDAKKSVADAEAAEAAEARRRAIEEAKSRPLDERAELLEELAREETERADKIQRRADTMYQTAEKMRARAARTRRHLEETVEDSFEDPESVRDGDGEEE